jgi:sulfate adenylyltransferase subunit 2
MSIGPPGEHYSLSVLAELEAEAIHVLREVAAEFERPAMMYSVGKDSSVLLRLAQKAFAPGRIPFPLLHVDTSDRFPEMSAFRDRVCREAGVDLRVHQSQAALAGGNYDALIGGARREEERSRATERMFSFRDRSGQWDPHNQRPELWSLYNGRVNPGESIRASPLSNWTELDVWRYIAAERIAVAPLYFAAEREVLVRAGQLIPVGEKTRLQPGEKPQRIRCRFRTLGGYPGMGAVRSSAATVEEVIAELEHTRARETS